MPRRTFGGRWQESTVSRRYEDDSSSSSESSSDDSESDLYRRIDEWAKSGPYTFGDAFAMAKECAAGKRWQLGDTLDEIYDRFVPGDLAVMAEPEKFLSPRGVKKWRKGTDNWTPGYPNARLTDEQIASIATPDVWEKTSSRLWHRVYEAEEIALLLKAIRDVERLRLSRKDSEEEEGAEEEGAEEESGEDSEEEA